MYILSYSTPLMEADKNYFYTELLDWVYHFQS